MASLKKEKEKERLELPKKNTFSQLSGFLKSITAQWSSLVHSKHFLSS